MRKAGSGAAYVTSPSSVQLAVRLRAIDAKRVEFRNLMQETFLRRDRDDHAPIDQEDRLAKLQIPVTQGQALALECCDGEVRSLEEIEHRLGIAGVHARC